jgi:plasmid stabilization system protein ParE
MNDQSWVEDIVSSIEERSGVDAAEVARELVEAATDMRLRPTLQPANVSGGRAYVPVVRASGDREVAIFALFEAGRVAVQIADLRRVNPFSAKDLEMQLRNRLAKVPGMAIDKPDYPDVRLTELIDTSARATFIDAMEWAAARVRGSNPS